MRCVPPLDALAAARERGERLTVTDVAAHLDVDSPAPAGWLRSPWNTGWSGVRPISATGDGPCWP